MIKKRKAESGFTLIEVLIVVAIILVMVAIAGPNLMASSSQNKMRTAARDLKNNLELARVAAVKNHKSVVFRLAEGGECAANIFTSGGGYELLIDKDGDSTQFDDTQAEAVELFGRSGSDPKYTPSADVAICSLGTSGSIAGYAAAFYFTARGFPATGVSGGNMFSAPLTLTVTGEYGAGTRPAYEVTVAPGGNVSITRTSLH